MDDVLLPFRRYFDFSGRSRRKEYWLYLLAFLVVTGLAAGLDHALGLNGAFSRNYVSETGAEFHFEANGGLLVAIWGLLNVIPSLAVSVRRLHDTDRSAWWMLIVLIPLVGFVVWIVFMCQAGTLGPNRFGPDPKDRLPPA